MGQSPKTKRATKSKEIKSTPDSSSNLGAPTKYDPKYCEEIIEHAKHLGGTYQSFAIKLGVHSDTIQEWAKVHPDFSVAKKRAGEIQEQVMMKLGMRGMMGENGSGAWQAAWIFMMKARFKWKEEPLEDAEEFDVDALRVRSILF